jgi:large subunit ribosomal protein L35
VKKPSGLPSSGTVSDTLQGIKRKSDGIMPKMKTKKSAAKRFRVRGSGSVKRGQAFKRHILTKKTTKNKRQLRGTEGVHSTNMASVKAMLPYA